MAARANVDLEAVPALRLLAHDGDRFELDGRGLKFPLDQDQAVFDKLDGFDSVKRAARPTSRPARSLSCASTSRATAATRRTR